MLNAGRPPEIRVDRPFLLYFEMTLYIILLFIALCAGMALSVYAFGTGGKRKRIFQDIYFSVEDTNGVGVLYTKTGEYSAILKIENPVQKYCANIDSYYEFTHLFTALAQTLGEGYALHKQDIFIRKQFENETGDKHEFLSSAYFRYFKGRNYTDSVCYLTITQEAKKSRLFSFDNKKWRDFLVKIRKVHDQLHDAGVQARFLNKAEASEYVDRYFAMNFKERIVSMTNFKADDETVSMGDKRCKVYSLVDVDCAALPSLIRPYTNIEVNNTDMPVDLLAAIDNIPNAETVVYNQIVFLPNQKRELALLDKKEEPARQYSQSEQPDGRGGHQAGAGGHRAGKQAARVHPFQPDRRRTGRYGPAKMHEPLGECFRTYGYPYFQKGVQPTGTVRELVSG